MVTKKKRARYSKETKGAVMAALLEGQSIGEVADQYSIPFSTVANWRRDADGIDISPANQDIIGELLIAYLSTSLTSLQKQVELFGDERWLRQQEASGVAVLHGVQSDKAHRLIELLSRNDDGSPPTS